MSPRKLLKEIILVDDCSTDFEFYYNFESYINNNFPRGLVRLSRFRTRVGSIIARLHGLKIATGEVVLYLDGHMEVNHDWLEPMVQQIKNDRKSVAMSTIDYIHRFDLSYFYYEHFYPRYGFNWKLDVFETHLRSDQITNNDYHVNKPGPVTLGSAFAADRQFLNDIEFFDPNMEVWGGDNVEQSWHVWLCGGSLIHVPCSRIGHVARSQPYVFPGGRDNVLIRNYQQAIDVWLGDEKKIVYYMFPTMNIANENSPKTKSRRMLRDRLKCKPFLWYIENIWPELNIFYLNSTYWGQVINKGNGLCLDNSNHLWSVAVDKLIVHPCHGNIGVQGFSLSAMGMFKSQLQCVVVIDKRPLLGSCFDDKVHQTWKYNSDTLRLMHQTSGLCLQPTSLRKLQMTSCISNDPTMQWKFKKIKL